MTPAQHTVLTRLAAEETLRECGNGHGGTIYLLGEDEARVHYRTMDLLLEMAWIEPEVFDNTVRVFFITPAGKAALEQQNVS